MGARHLISVACGLAVLAIIGWDANRHRAGSRMAESIRESIESAPEISSLADLDVRVDGATRTAVISGAVDTEAERVAVRNAALRKPGLVTVWSEVSVDDLHHELLARLKRARDAEPGEGEFGYDIGPDGHTVTLQGWVPEGEEDVRDTIEELVRKFPGVRRVNNEMSVGRPTDQLDAAQRRIYEILRLGNIYFDYNKATIRSESRASLAKIAGVLLHEYPSIRIRIEGHTDSIASERYNQRLSERRTESVASALIELGVSTARIDTVGFGETRPVAPNDMPEGRAENRRIEFVPLSATETTPGRPTTDG